MFKLASLFVDITAEDKQFQGKLAGIGNQLGTFGTATAVAFGNVTSAAILGATSAVVGFFSTGLKGAVDLVESLQKVQVMFGDSASVIVAEADRMAVSAGIVKGEWIDAAASFGQVFKAAGDTQAEAAAIGNRLAKLGTDISSLGNGTAQEVFVALQAALRGEFDPLERFGILLKAADVEDEALRLGLIKTKKELDAHSKAHATLSLFMNRSTDAQGDLERSATSSANSWRKLTGTMTNLSIAVGTKLEPALNSVIGLGNEMALSVVSGAERADGAFKAFADGVKSGVETVGVVWRNFGDIWEMTTVSIGGALANAWARVEAFGANVVQVAGWVGRNWFDLISDGVEASGRALANLGSNLGELAAAVGRFLSDPTQGFRFEWTPLLEGFEATTEALPELIKPALVDVQGEIDAIQDRMVDREGKRLDKLAAAKKAAAAVAKPGAADAAAAKKKSDFKSELIGSAEFSAKLRASILTGGDDVAKKQLEKQGEIAAATKETAEAVKRPRVAVLG